MYVYESHMGGMYTSEEPVEDLYCETCGDSDFEIGRFETAEEAWEALKPSDLECIGCTDRKDDCMPCGKINGYGRCDGYDLTYIMRLICTDFETENHIRVVLLCRNPETGEILVTEREDGIRKDKPSPFSCPCLNEELTGKVAICLRPTWYCETGDPVFIRKIRKENGNTDMIYECIADIRTTDTDKEYSNEDGWVFWENPSEIGY